MLQNINQKNKRIYQKMFPTKTIKEDTSLNDTKVNM